MGTSAAGPWVRRLALCVGLTAGAYLVSTVPLVRGHARYVWWLDATLPMAALLLSIALVVARAAQVREERRFCVALASAIALWTAGYVAWLVQIGPGGSAPVPSVSDIGYLGFYPPAYLALGQLLRARGARIHASMWLDGVVAGLTVAAIAAAVCFDWVADATGGSVQTVAVTLAYPVADLLVLALIAGTLVLHGGRPMRSLIVFGVGLAVFAIGDALFMFQTSSGRYVTGSTVTATWPVGCAIMAFAPWARARRFEMEWAGTTVVLLPALCTLCGLAIVALSRVVAIPTPAFVLACVAIAVAVGRTVLTFREVRELGERRAEARTDELTGLANRRALTWHLERVVRGGERASLLLLDLDHFKELNDTLGHAAGDELLRRIGPRLRAVLGPSDVLARLGGDEFGIIVAGTPGEPRRALMVAHELLNMLEEPFDLRGIALRVDGSIGVAHHPEHATDASGLLQRADIAMYLAKERRSGVEVYDAGRDHHTPDQLALAGQLRGAIAAGELVVVHQPKVDLATGAVTSTEALVRWRHPTEGLLAPAAFLPLAEQTNAMGPLALQVLELALADVAAWRARGEAVEVAVNLATANLLDVELPGIVRAALERHGVPASALRFEVTETSVLADAERCVSVLEGLRDLGVGLSLDDFGTGHASLSRLATLPVDELKIDRSFVSDVAVNAAHRAIARTIVDLGRSLGLRVVAEGIEDAECLAVVRALGCDVAQGFGLGRPMPAAEVVFGRAAGDPGRSMTA
ncbi:MAG TPA: EAL domain-containing protein [Baekduia sp.]|uniref:putative bifunctional diguanylate cyclase/phosphodiesterase n=1 Tax=Baekduia sp. TaxID=2600305 RepID=UPI002D778BB3|nr:EAL domain-containing protein [Baekduia sp.]HET6507540.1 EAL domain-containing protein [Baekduia sp.]